MDAGGDRAIYPTNMAVVIKDIYDSEYPHQKFAMELEKALDEKRMVIIIEPTQLGDETARWISFGNCLHKTSVISGAGSIVASNISILCFHTVLEIGNYLADKIHESTIAVSILHGNIIIS